MNATRKSSLFKRVLTAVCGRLWSAVCVDEMHLSPADASVFTTYGGQFDDAVWTSNAIMQSKLEYWR